MVYEYKSKYEQFDELLNYYKQNLSVKEFLRDFYPFDYHDSFRVDESKLSEEELLQAYREIYKIREKLFKY